MSGASLSYFDWHARPGNAGDITRHIRPGDRVLDLGCGTAWLSADCSSYVGLDSSAEAIAQATEHGIDARVADLEQPLELPDGEFDLIIAKDILEHLQRPGETVAELLRVLKPGGRVYACSPDAQNWVWDDYTHVRPFSRHGFRRLFEDQGFRVDKVTYMSLILGSWFIADHTKKKQQPRWLRAMAWFPGAKRNVELTATKT
jgi:SAM-dependent methyltransferase